MPASTAVAPKVTIKVNGSPLQPPIASQLTEFVVDHRRNAPDLFRLSFHDPQMLLVDDQTFKVGADVEIGVEIDPQAKGVLTAGQITSIKLEDAEWGTLLIVQGMDRSHALFRNRRAEVHLNVTYSDIAKKIASEAGLQAAVAATTTVYPYLSQNGLTDWEFLRMMADDLGFDVWVEGRSLHFDKAAEASAAPVTELKRGVNLTQLSVVATGGGQTAKEVQVRGWDPAQQKAVVSTATTAATVAAAVGIGAPSAVRGSFNGGTVTVTRTPVRTDAEAQVIAKAAAESIASGFVELTGAASGDPRLKARSTIKISGAGTRFSGTYVLTEARHIWETDEGYRTEFTATGRHDRSLHSLAGWTTGYAESGASKVYGLVVGVVTNLKDPDNLGRVKVKLPWLHDDHESNWARVVQLLGGKGHGSLLMPDVNDEVLVGFEHGDINHPYVLGTLYSKRNGPDKAVKKLVSSDGKVASQRIETSSHNRLVFYDHASKQGITLRTGDDKFFIDLNKTETKITVSSDGDIIIDAKKGTVKLNANEMELECAANLNVEAGASATFKAGANFTVEAGAKLELKGGAAVEVTGPIVKLN